jgi:hypothetical protein
MDHNPKKKRTGRPPLPAGQQKERVSVRLPPPLLDRLRAEESPAKTIAAALQNYYKTKETGNV